MSSSTESWPAFEVVPVKFYFFRRAHAVEFRDKLRELGIECTFGQTFSGARERWLVTAGWQVLEYGSALYQWLSEAVERWKAKTNG